MTTQHDTEPRVKRALPLLNDAGQRLAFGGSFTTPPRYEDWPDAAAAMERRAVMEAKAEAARAATRRIVQLTFFDLAA